MRIGVVGAGKWGQNIIRILKELNAWAWTIDTNEELCENTKNNATAVCIATPADTHYALAKEFLYTGHHVFVEKPLSLNIKDCKELIDLAKKKNKILMVGHILHYHPAIKQLKKIITNGDLGTIKYIYSNRLNNGRVRKNINVLYSFAPHDISLFNFIFGVPTKINASGDNNSTITTIHYNNDIKGHIFVSWHHPFKEHRIVIEGSLKTAVFYDEILSIYDNGTNNPPKIYRPIEEPLKNELQHFIDCINNNHLPITDGNEGLKVIEILENCSKQLANDYNKNNYFAHPTSIIDKNVKIGAGTKIWHWCHIREGSCIGKNCTIGKRIDIGPNVNIGDNCKIQNNTQIFEGVNIANNVFIGPSVVFTNVKNPNANIKSINYLKTFIGEGSVIGANATILPGIILYDKTFVGAGSVVTKNTSYGSILIGNPAKIIDNFGL